jgi:hypothetical protein
MPRQNTPGISPLDVTGQPESAAFHTDNGFTALPKGPANLPALMRYRRFVDHNALALFISLIEKFTFRREGRTIVTPCGFTIHLLFAQAFVTQTELAKKATRSRGYAYSKLKALEKLGHVELTPVYPPGSKRAVGTIVTDLMGIIRDLDGCGVNQPPNQSPAPPKFNSDNGLSQKPARLSINVPVVPKTASLEEQSIPTHHPSGEKIPALPVLESASAASAPDSADPASTSFPSEGTQEPQSADSPEVGQAQIEEGQEDQKPDFADPATAFQESEDGQESQEQEAEKKKPGKKKKPSPYSPEKRQAATKRKKQRRAAERKASPKPKTGPTKKLPPSVQRLRQAWEAEGLHQSDRPTQGYHAGPTIHACLEAIDLAGHTQPIVQAMERYAAKLRASNKLKLYAQSFQNFFLKGTYLDFLPPEEPEPVKQARQMLYEAFGLQHRNVADDIAISVETDAQGQPFYRFKGGDLFQLIVPAQRHLLAPLPLERIEWECCAGARTAERVLEDLEYGFFDDFGTYREYPRDADDPSFGLPAS